MKARLGENLKVSGSDRILAVIFLLMTVIWTGEVLEMLTHKRMACVVSFDFPLRH